MKLSISSKLYWVVIRLFLLVPCVSFGQDLGAKIKVTYGSSDKSSFYVYDSTFIIKIISDRSSSNVIECPEKLLQSIYSASDQNWFDFNVYGGSANSEKKKENYFANVKSTNKEKYFIKPVHKLNFVIDDVQYCIVKYFIHIEEAREPMAAVTLMVYDQGRWYKMKDHIFALGSIAFLKVKSDKLYDLFYNPGKDSFVKEVRTKVVDENGFNFLKFAKLMNSWYEDKNETYIKYFVDEKAW